MKCHKCGQVLLVVSYNAALHFTKLSISYFVPFKTLCFVSFESVNALLLKVILYNHDDNITIFEPKMLKSMFDLVGTCFVPLYFFYNLASTLSRVGILLMPLERCYRSFH